MNLFKVIKIIIDDKIYQRDGHNERVNKINSILKLTKKYNTKPFTVEDRKYIVEYSKGRFWYDGQPITIKNIINKFSYWHVHHWRVYPEGDKCGYETNIVPGYFSKKNIYIFLEEESKSIDRIITAFNVEKE